MNSQQHSYFYSGATILIVPRLNLLKFLDHTQLNTHTHTHTGQESSEPIISSSQTQHTTKLLPDTTHNKRKETNIYALGGIRTRETRNRAASHLGPRPHGYGDRQ